MVKGMKALTYSADLPPEDEQEEPGKIDLWIEKALRRGEGQGHHHRHGRGARHRAVDRAVHPDPDAARRPDRQLHPQPRRAQPLLRACCASLIFLLYLWGVAHMKDVERMFAYHGAEHKTIFCYEKGPAADGRERAAAVALFTPPLRHELSVRRRHHQHSRVLAREPARRAGDNPWVRIGLRLLLLPVVVSISYEINRWVGRHDNLCSRILSGAGQGLQRLTTNEPDDSMIECAIRALGARHPGRERQRRLVIRQQRTGR